MSTKKTFLFKTHQTLPHKAPLTFPHISDKYVKWSFMESTDIQLYISTLMYVCRSCREARHHSPHVLQLVFGALMSEALLARA